MDKEFMRDENLDNEEAVAEAEAEADVSYAAAEGGFGAEADADEAAVNSKKEKGYGMKDLIKDIVIVAVIVFAVTFFIKPIIVSGSSMETTLMDRDYLFISKQTYKVTEPKYKDIVVFPHDDGMVKELYIKRVIGVPGDEIDIENGHVFVNDQLIEEEYIHGAYTAGDIENFVVPEGEIFVMGDNREHSSDSRVFGTVPIDQVTGVAFVRLFPFNKIGLL